MNPTEHKTRRARRAGVGTGTASLLVIFTVLCMATLAVLSLTTAVSGGRIHRKALASAEALAAAEGEADRMLASMDAALHEVYGGVFAGESPAGGDAAAQTQRYYEEAGLAVAALDYDLTISGQVVTYTCPIDDASELVTELLILPPGGQARYEVLRRVSHTTADWTPDPEGQLWTGE